MAGYDFSKISKELNRI